MLKKIVARIKQIEIKKRIWLTQEAGLFYFWKYFYSGNTPSIDDERIIELQQNNSILSKALLYDIDKAGIISDADRICLGELRIYHFPPEHIKHDLDWHKDYFSEHTWPLKSFHEIYDPNDSGVDLNVPFELSRMQFVPTLIQAWLLTSDAKYINRLDEIINDWERKNPFCFGINWWSCMEVGLRSVNLSLAVIYLTGKVPSKKMRSYYNLLWKHAFYIHRYDILNSADKNKNNHFLGAMLGLFASAFLFKGATADTYRALALTETKKEIPRQFYRDGGNFESATAYHQFSLEVILTLILFCRLDEKDETEEFVEKRFGNTIKSILVNALDLASDYMACYGQSPHIGDSSDCRVFVVKDYFTRNAFDHHFLRSLGQCVLHYDSGERKNHVDAFYPDSGYAMFKNKDYGLVAFAGPKGTGGTGGHGHNDKCSFVMQVNGQPVFVDSGTYIYNPSINERYKFKKSRSHNVMLIGDREQCDIKPERVFGIIGPIESNVEKDNDIQTGKIKMTHSGYSSLKNVGDYRRKIEHMEKGIVITDQITGTGTQEISSVFNIHPECSVHVEGNAFWVTTAHCKIKVSFKEECKTTIEDSFYSATYHHKVENSVVVAGMLKELPFTWETMIEIKESHIDQSCV